ncbi:MAG: protein kinase domain-containing protein, partial [Thermodesulfobacteriota bacterium]
MTDQNNNKKATGASIESLTAYFLRLYKIHLGMSQDSPSEIIPVGPYAPNPKLFTYDLRVEQRGEWISRRLTLGRIAEDTGSKSSCFFAIFDKQLVIKIPPTPVKDFDTYLKQIARDKEIARILAPRPCLIPGVSAILSRVHKFPRDHEIKGEQRENIYYEWLRYSTENQVFLKIDGRFAFFMDLAQHMFLPDVVCLFHGQDKKMQQEITHDVLILDTLEKFEGRYGMEYMQLGVELKAALDACESRVRRTISHAAQGRSGRHDATREWFFRYIAGLPPVKTPDELPEGELAKLRDLLAAVTEENRPVIDDYKTMITAHLRRSSASKLTLYMANVAANLLDALAWLKEKGVAIRDIKPDNLLVAGDQARFPVFLGDLSQFSIGLIDFETAVVFRPEKGDVPQPMLGGTPPYATPLNIFSNRMIASVYRDLDRGLYLQDWYAMAALIYGIITGAPLFGKTSRLFLVLPQKMAEAGKAGKSA